MSDYDPAIDSNLIKSNYTNYFEIGFNAHEVILNCGQFYAGDEKPFIHTRLLTSPAYAEALLELLRDTLDQRKRSLGDVD